MATLSKTFQILYRAEEVCPGNMFLFRVHLVLDSARIEEMRAAAKFCLELQLWFSEAGGDRGHDQPHPGA